MTCAFCRCDGRSPLAITGVTVNPISEFVKQEVVSAGESLSLYSLTELDTIFTAAANAVVRCVHHRMPVILDPKYEKLWLDMRASDTEDLLPIFRPYESALMHGYKVSSFVNSPENNSPDCLKPEQP